MITRDEPDPFAVGLSRWDLGVCDSAESCALQCGCWVILLLIGALSDSFDPSRIECRAGIGRIQVVTSPVPGYALETHGGTIAQSTTIVDFVASADSRHLPEAAPVELNREFTVSLVPTFIHTREDGWCVWGDAGRLCDGISGCINIYKGEYGDAFICFAAIVPGGDVLKLLKLKKPQKNNNESRVPLDDGRKVDLDGKPHANRDGISVPTPHVHDPKPANRRNTDKKREKDVRPATQKDLDDASDHLKKERDK